MGFSPPALPKAPPPPPQPPSLAGELSAKAPTPRFGNASGSLGGTFITGPGAMSNIPGSTGQSGLKTLTGQ